MSVAVATCSDSILTKILRGASFYKVELSSPLKPEETTTLQLGVAYTNRYVPTPEFGTEFDSQLFVFENSCYAFSAYPSAEQVLNIG